MLGDSLRAAKVLGLNHALPSSFFAFSSNKPAPVVRFSVAPSNLLSIPCEYGLQNPPGPFLSSAGSFASGIRRLGRAGNICEAFRDQPPQPERVLHREDGRFRVLLEPAGCCLCGAEKMRVITTDPAEGGQIARRDDGHHCRRRLYRLNSGGRHLDVHQLTGASAGDSMLADRPKSMGKSKASSAHQANRVRPSNSKRCGVSWRVKPRPATLPCSSHSAMGNRSSAARTSSGDLAEMAAISSGDAGLLLANKSSVGGMISRKTLPPVALIGAVIRAASSWSSLVFIWHLLSGTWILYGPAYREGRCVPSG